jgi:GT2 family glycosyltransferase/SAM-dependent methyltransferase
LQYFGKVADEIVQQLHPRRVLDVGCAKGFLVESLRDRGVEAYGFDVSDYAISQVRADMKPYCWVASGTDAIEGEFDLITCIEVCEHLPESEANETVRQLASHSDTILFSSTPSDFSEPTHVNVRPIIDWLRLFAEFGFAPDEKFDAGFVAAQAVLYRRAQVRPLDQTLCRFASLRNQAVARHELNVPEISALQEELNSIRGSKGWKILSRYRDLRFRLKHPIAQAIRRLRDDHHLSYEHWIKHVEKPANNHLRIAQDIGGFSYKPKISIVMPVHNTPLELLDSAIRSVQAQQYENWELCICDDSSQSPELKTCLRNWLERDPRIKVTYSPKNEGISEASNRALGLATGEFVGLLDHDDELASNALYEVAKLLEKHPDADMIYSDEDKFDSHDRRVQPFFKPDWSPEYMLACMYTCHFGVYRKSVVNQIGAFRSGFEGSQDYDLVLRLAEKTDCIYHIPKILYHWRMAPDSVAFSGAAKPYAYTAARRALSEHLERQGISGQITDGPRPGSYRLRFNLRGTDKVSIIISTSKSEALTRCVESIRKKTAYPNYEIIVTDSENGNRDGGHSRLMNFGAKRAAGDYLLLLDGNTEIISGDWIDSMLGFCQRPQVGIVGAKLLYRNDLIQHAGIALGIKGLAGYPLRRLPRGTTLGNGLSCTTRNCSAVSGACMMVRKEVFEEIGGFDEALSAGSNDLNFCLRVREAGYRIVWTPEAELYYDDLPQYDRQKPAREIAYLKKRWRKALASDPYYNPNLTLRHEDMGYRVSAKDRA